ncbi:hypothetical protein KP509_37G025800 [Ceratopteris richardii]|uniref:Uncharacterized protein n=1 Tax=Ceratopteris richardii TaxID=49495 RepID=A0A8T2Q739_CERRI|nr:hypothetical protein KP509_37G025800 [Ceratopteris richardii]
MGHLEIPSLTVMFSCCKQESHTTLQGFKSLAKQLCGKYQIILNKEDLLLHTLERANAVIFGCPQENFSPIELESIKSYINGGGSILYLSKEGGDARHGANGNELLEEYGIKINNNCLISTVQKRYLHPKQVLISDCILCEDIRKFVNSEDSTKLESAKVQRFMLESQDPLPFQDASFSVVYPNGATLSLQKPAVAILSSGLMAHPVCQPIGALSQAMEKDGRIAAVGSVSMFEDEWIDKEKNAKLFDFILSWLVEKLPIKIDMINTEDLESNGLDCVPDIGALADRLRCCLQEAEELPRDFTKLPDENLFTYHMDLVPEVINLYKRLGVRAGPLTLIAPEFETPTPPLLPAVFPPFLREPPSPPLDLFNLDDCFAPPSVHLARLTNRCKVADQEDLIYYIKESAFIMGIKTEALADQAQSDEGKAKAILSSIMKKIFEMKKLSENSLALTPNVL